MARFDKLEIGSPGAEPQTGCSPAGEEHNATWWMKQADEQRRCGWYENALRYYSRALEEDKSQVAGWVGQVQMLIALDEPNEADLWSRKALELFPAHGDLLAGRAQARCRLGDFKQAFTLSDGAFQQEGNSAYRWLVRGEIQVAGAKDTDRHCFDKAQLVDADWLVPLEIALVYWHYERPGLGLPRAGRAIEAAPDRYYAWYVQGLMQFELGMNGPARKSLQMCLELSPQHRDAQQRLFELDNRGWSLRRAVRRLFRS